MARLHSSAHDSPVDFGELSVRVLARASQPEDWSANIPDAITRTISAQVTDTKHRPLGRKRIRVEFADGVPVCVEHAGRTFVRNGKSGTNPRTGQPVQEMSAVGDARIWITLDGKQVYED